MLLALAAPPASADEAAPQWSAAELKQLFARQMAARNDDDSVNNAGSAYRLPRAPGEPVDAYAKRIVKKRRADHPELKPGGWLLAAFGLFYRDVSARSATISRFERDRNERQFFEQKSRETGALAEQAAKEVMLSIEGVPGYMAPPPIVEECEPATKYGVEISMRSGAITVENLERAKFVNDQAPPEAPRTSKGAMRELFASQLTYNTNQKMLGMYEPRSAKNRGNVMLTLPGAAPAIYLNEIAQGSIEAEMQVIHLMVLKKGTEVCEVSLPLTVPKTKKKPAKKPKKGAAPIASQSEPTAVKCPSDVSMQKCVEHVLEQKKKGPIVFRVL